MRKRNSLKLFVSAMVLSMIMTGCGAKSDNYAGDMAASGTTAGSSMDYGYDNILMEDSGDYKKPEMSQDNTDAVNERKLIKNVDMTVETKEFDALLTAMQDKVKELGGYIENMESYNGSAYTEYRSDRNASLIIRIPQNKLDIFLKEVSEGCNVIRRSENVKDVTLTYVDLESHKNVLLAEQERLLELIEQAEYIEEIITIEQRLSDVRYQIESMESQLRTFDNKINYSTVTMQVQEVKELTPVEEKSTLRRMGDGFMNSLEDVASGLKEFIIWFISCIPYFILWAIIIGFAFCIFRKINKKKNKEDKNHLNKVEETKEQEIKE